jgi:hypothetical protein
MTLTAQDLATIADDVAAIVDEYGFMAVSRRGGVTMPAQKVRVALSGPGGRKEGAYTQQAMAQATIVGAAGLDIQVDDVWLINDARYRVVLVHPDRRAFVQAQAELEQ